MTGTDIYAAVFLMIGYDRESDWLIYPHPKREDSLPLDWRSSEIVLGGDWVWEGEHL